VKLASVLARALLLGGIVTLGIAILGSAIGFLVAGTSGLASALIGALLAALFMALTAASVLAAGRVTKHRPSSTVFFGIILGAWALKVAVFLVAIIAIRGQSWLSPYVFFWAVIVAVIGSLVADIVAMQTTPVSYVGDFALPSENTPTSGVNSAGGP
jgi:hypothetical protein